MKKLSLKIIILLSVFFGLFQPVHAGFMSSRMAKGSVITAIVASGIYFATKFVKTQQAQYVSSKAQIESLKNLYNPSKSADLTKDQAFFKIITGFISGLESDFLLWGGCDEFDRLINGLEGKKLADAVDVDRSDVMHVKSYVLGSSYGAFADWYQEYCVGYEKKSDSMNACNLKEALKSYEVQVENDLKALCQYASITLEEINAVTHSRPTLFDAGADLDACAYLQDAQKGLCDYADVDALLKKVRGLKPGYVSWFGCDYFYNHRDVTDLIIWCVQVRKAIMQLCWIMLQLSGSCEFLGAVACVPPGYE